MLGVSKKVKAKARINVNRIDCEVDFDNNGYSVEVQYKIIGRADRPVAVEFFLERTR